MADDFTMSGMACVSNRPPGGFRFEPLSPPPVTVIINPAGWRRQCERLFDVAHPALAPKASLRRTRRRRWRYVGADRPSYRIPNVRFRPKAWEEVAGEGFETVEFAGSEIRREG